MSKEDLKSLAALMTQGLPAQPEAFEFSASKGDVTYSAHSIEELLSQDIPSSLDGVRFRVFGWADSGIGRSISIDLRPIHAECYIRAVDDDVWFKGKMQQIKEFFNLRRSWYSRYRWSFPALFGITLTLIISAAIHLLAARHYVYAAAAVLIIILLIKFIVADINRRLFPVTSIRLVEKAQPVSKEILALIFAGFSALASIVGVIAQIWLTHRSG